MDNTELTHHGVLGMKWGVRRYQNKDGTLTPRGKKRYEKEMAKLSERERVLKNHYKTQAKLKKLHDKRKEIEELEEGLTNKRLKEAPPTKPVPDASRERLNKSAKDMSDDELRDVVKRLQLEKQLNDLRPEQKSLGRRFAEKVFKDVIVPVATEKAKSILKNGLDGEFGKKSNNSNNKPNNKSKQDSKPKQESKPKSEKKSKVYEGTVIGGPGKTGKRGSKWKKSSKYARSTVDSYGWDPSYYADVGSRAMNLLLLED